MNDLLASIQTKKANLDQFGPMSAAALRHLQKYYDVEHSYFERN